LNIKLPPNVNKIPYEIFSLEIKDKDRSFFFENSKEVYQKYEKEINFIAK
jgi:hypothetical protein